MERLPAGEVRTGQLYETERVADRARLASAAGLRRVALGPDLVLVLETHDSVRMALEELLRAERVNDRDRVAGEAVAFAELLGEKADVPATLYVDVADPVELAERLSELAGIENAVTLEVGGRRVAARSDPGDGGSGAFHLLFSLDADQWASLRAGAGGSVGVDHPACRAVAAISPELARAIGAESTR